MNFIFISPHFPKTYYQFTKALKEEGFNSLGIGDMDYNSLSYELKTSLTEYYKVNNMNNYQEMFKAVAYFTYKYGHIDYIESNNEYWLEQDARLREDFNINTGKKGKAIASFKSKELEKKYYKKAGVKTARYVIPTTISKAKKFIALVGYPVIVKPDNGVGASKTYSLKNDDELKSFFKTKPQVKYIMEEFVEGDLISFDGISNSKAYPVFYSNEVFPNQIMNVVNEKSDVYYYSNKECPSDLLDAGEKVLKAFNAKYRYFHLEFFRLREDKEGLGKKGDLIGLEVNMRCPGGYTPDIINYSKSANTYKIYAQVMKMDKTTEDLNKEKFYAIYIGRRYGIDYKHDISSIYSEYKNNIVMHDIMPPILSDAMGNESIVAKFSSLEDATKFKDYAMLRN